MPPDSPPLSAVLSEASRVIATVIAGKNLDRALTGVPRPLRPGVQELAYGALRQYGRGDFMLSRLLDSPLQHPGARGLLLAAIYRLELRPEDAHTTVNQAVEAAGACAGGRYRALVNAVLRGFLRQRNALNGAAEQDVVAHWQHPRWWIDRVQGSLPEAWQDVLRAGNGRPPMTLRVNRRKCSTAAYLAELAAAGIAARGLGGSAIMLAQPLPTERLPGFAEGRVSVQDFGAQRAAGLLDVGDGMRVLDACAAPGGKAAHLLESADIDLLALDADPQRLQRVADNLRRLGLEAQLRAADCRARPDWWDGRPFDRVLADVPCSASGVVRRHPDAKWLRRESDIAQFAAIQAEILDSLWQVLAPDGKMLYCTCSVFQEENQMQVESFTGRRRNVSDAGSAGQGRQQQLIPDADHDGFYYAVLEKRA